MIAIGLALESLLMLESSAPLSLHRIMRRNINVRLLLLLLLLQILPVVYF